MSRQRMRTDFRFAITTLFGLVTVLGVAPFAIYRLAQGQVLVGVVDIGIVLGIIAGVAHAWRGGDLRIASLVVMATYNLGGLLVASMIGLAGILWMYPVLMANFLLAGYRTAVPVAAVSIAALLLVPGVFANSLQMMLFLVTSVVLCVFAFIFAYRAESQRARMEALASHDPLTGVFNRRALERELQIAIEAFARQRTPHGLAVLDLDHFKRVNDSFGHEEGDRVLVDFTRLVAHGTRKGDRLFRLGGEEFVLMLPGADDAALQVLCEHAREHVAAGLQCGGLPITVSIGAAALRPGDDAGNWLGRADAAMYQAKNHGRNAVVVADSRQAAPPGDAAPRVATPG